MDRARRIRELREGGRSDDAEEQENQTDADSTEPTEETDSERDAGRSVDENDDGLSADEKDDDGLSADENEQNAEKGGDQTDISVPSVNDTDTTPTDLTEDVADDESGISAPLPGADDLEAALDEAGADSEAETVGPAVDQEETQDEEETRVLEFTLDGEHFCLDIEYIEEIVKKETITRVPNTEDFVEGVVDLRGQITTILNPKVILEKENTGAGDLIIVFDVDSFDDQGNVGWVVDDVRQVSPITKSDVNDPPMAEDHINGVIDRDDEDEFVIWTTPELTMQDEAEG